MKKLNKVAMLFASATIALSAASAFAQSNEDNWVSPNDLVWKNGDQTLCWRDNFWTPATAHPDCDGAAVPVVDVVDVVQETELGSERMVFSADTFFDFDKATLKPAGKQALDELAYYIGTLDALEVIVATGYTDSTGPAAYNLKLSVWRAEAVKAYLVEKGIPAQAIFIEGKGEADPIATNKTREGRAQNRRVEVEVIGSKTIQN